MRKILSLAFTLILVAALTLPALADGWYCPSCGRYNDNNFCPKDGTRKPADLDKSSSTGSTASQNRVGVEPVKSVKFQSKYDGETNKEYAIITGYGY